MKLALSILFLVCSAAAQEDRELRVERVSVGHAYTDGPLWSHENYLLFSDVPNGKLLQVKPGEKPEVYRGNSNGASGITFDTQGRLYSCETHLRRVTRSGKNGKIEVLAERWQGKRLNAPNDIVVRKDGEVYFTDPAFGNQHDSQELDFYGVYRIPRKGELELVAKMKTRPNGIALSPAGHILYVGNSDERNVRAYDLDKNGAASNERILIPHTGGIPDGIRIDEKGNLYVAANAIEIYTPEGKLAGSITIPETPSNCAFGDSDFQTLYVTARTTVYRVRLDVKGSVQY